jgi:hypothetical protein
LWGLCELRITNVEVAGKDEVWKAVTIQIRGDQAVGRLRCGRTWVLYFRKVHMSGARRVEKDPVPGCVVGEQQIRCAIAVEVDELHTRAIDVSQSCGGGHLIEMRARCGKRHKKAGDKA